jgi:hypothetical protein
MMLLELITTALFSAEKPLSIDATSAKENK